MATLTERLRARIDDGALDLSFHRGESAPPRRASYGQVTWFGQRIAAFDEEPLEPGARVLLILPQGHGLHGSFFASLWHGLVPSILAYPSFKMSAELYREQILALTRHLAAARIVTDAKVAGLLPGLPVRIVPDAPFPDDPSPRPTGAPFEPASTDVAFLQHSAGTTGLQKGVALSHGAVLEHIDDYAKALGSGPGDRVASWLPLYHDMGLIACLVLPMVRGLPSASMSPTDWVLRPGSILSMIEAERSTLAWWPNFTFPFLARKVGPDAPPHRLDSLRAIVNCSEPVSRTAYDAFLERFGAWGAREDQMHASYAMAENTFAVTQSVPGGPGPRTISVDRDAFERTATASLAGAGARPMTWTSSGRLFGANELRVADDGGAALGEGRVGELLVRSPYMLTGYWGRPDLTEAALANGWYHTGDLGFVLDGEVFVTGRKRDLIIVGGRNLYPQDVEDLVSSDPDVHDGRVVAVGQWDAQTGTEELIIAAETHRAEQAEGESAFELQARIRRAVVSTFEISPSEVLVVPPMWLLKSSAGKISRSRNRDKIAAALGKVPR